METLADLGRALGAYDEVKHAFGGVRDGGDVLCALDAGHHVLA